MNHPKEKAYLRAQERVKEIKTFYGHLATYIVINLILFTLNYMSNQLENPWFLWVTFGWGIGLAFGAIRTFGINPLYGKNWEERKIQEFMEKEKTQRWE